MEFKDKVVLITGASRGIGASTAKHFAEKGAQVIINYHPSKFEENAKENAKEVLKSIEEKKGKAKLIQADISKEKEVEKDNRRLKRRENMYLHKTLLSKCTMAVAAMAISMSKNRMNTGVRMVPSPKPLKKVSMEAPKATKTTKSNSIMRREVRTQKKPGTCHCIFPVKHPKP